MSLACLLNGCVLICNIFVFKRSSNKDYVIYMYFKMLKIAIIFIIIFVIIISIIIIINNIYYYY